MNDRLKYKPKGKRDRTKSNPDEESCCLTNAYENTSTERKNFMQIQKMEKTNDVSDLKMLEGSSKRKYNGKNKVK
jgi:hypothetical protein